MMSCNLRRHESSFAGRVTTKADIFSFGVVLWEICTAERPTRGRMRELRCALTSCKACQCQWPKLPSKQA